MHLRSIFTLLLLFFATASWAAEFKTFSLRDGSTLSGELIGLEGGRYLVRTPSLGEVALAVDQVLAINPAQRGGGGGSGGGSGSSGGFSLNGLTLDSSIDLGALLQQTQQRIQGDPALLQQVQALAHDPELAALANDPAFVQKILSGNLDALRSDPRVERLMYHPELQRLVGQLMSR